MPTTPAVPEQPPVLLLDCRPTPRALVPAAITRGYEAERLDEVERSWGPARGALAAAAAAAGHVLESSHWDWRRKLASVRDGRHILVAVEAAGEVQGLMAVHRRLRPSVLTPGRYVLYVDYLEAAPWNQPVPGVQTQRYAGVGTLLVGEAVRLSYGRTANGRVGLHALPQAEVFYTARCEMRPTGPDPGYHDLVYFEYPDGATAGWLTTRGLSA